MQRSLQFAAYVTLAVAMLPGCSPQQAPEPAHVAMQSVPRRKPEPPAPGVSPEPNADRLAPLRTMRGVHCDTTDGGERCATERYDLSGSSAVCDEHSSSFGAVFSPGGADLATDVDDAGAVHAHVSNQQFVCIQYTADSRSGGEGWSYVVAIPTSLISRCAKVATCPEAAAPVEWHGQAPTGTCAVADDLYNNACAQGWVKSSLIDAYSMGLDGEYAER